MCCIIEEKLFLDDIEKNDSNSQLDSDWLLKTSANQN